MALNKVINSGVLPQQPSYLQGKIRVSNIIGLIVGFGVAVPFTILSAIYFPPLTIVPILGLVISLGSIMLNKAGSNELARIIISLLPLVLAATYNMGLSSATDSPVLGVYMVELSFSITVFLVFDLREKTYMAILTAIAIAIIMTFDYTKALWEPEVDATIIREGYVGTMAIINSVLFAFGGVFSLVYQNQQAEKETARLLEEAEESNQRIAQSEVEMKASIEQLKNAQEEEKKRQWASEGLAKLSSILRDYDNAKSMGDRVIAYIIKYLEANQGGLFLVKEDEGEKEIQLLSCYAYNRKKYLKKSIAPGEGLLGQAYLEKEPIYLTEIPSDYVNITSGLGKATPRSLLIVPLKINDEVEGLLELASFNEFAPHEIEFIQTLGENIAATLKNNSINEKTKLLLQASQQQNEEIRAQEEEMRQNMEELQATQEQSERLREELEANQQLLQAKLQELEEAKKINEEAQRVEAERAAKQDKARSRMMDKMVNKYKKE